jgi:hypothetical protein
VGHIDDAVHTSALALVERLIAAGPSRSHTASDSDASDRTPLTAAT